MTRASALLAAGGGTDGPDRGVHDEHLGALAVQAAALLLWWPTYSLRDYLMDGSGPDTLAALLMAIGFSWSWQAMRVGGQETTTVRTARSPVGELVSALRSVPVAAWLSLPLIVAAALVGTASPVAVALGLLAVAALVPFYRMLAHLNGRLFGFSSAKAFVIARIGLAAGLLLPALLWPAASHVVLVARLFSADASALDPLPSTVVYASGHLLVAGLIALWLARREARAR